MSPAECVGLLGEIKLMTAARPEQAQDLEVQLMLYARKLAEYPADVVRKVLTTQAEHCRWWPTWAELKERLDPLNPRRGAIQDALMKPQPAPTPTAPKVERAVTPEAQAILDAYARKRESEATPIAEPTPEEMERRRLELLAMCQA
jgi:hypothetical protein